MLPACSPIGRDGMLTDVRMSAPDPGRSSTPTAEMSSGSRIPALAAASSTSSASGSLSAITAVGGGSSASAARPLGSPSRRTGPGAMTTRIGRSGPHPVWTPARRSPHIPIEFTPGVRVARVLEADIRTATSKPRMRAVRRHRACRNHAARAPSIRVKQPLSRFDHPPFGVGVPDLSRCTSTPGRPAWGSAHGRRSGRTVALGGRVPSTGLT